MNGSPGNPVLAQAGIIQRNTIVELVTHNVDHGGDGMTRAEIAKAIGISKPSLHRHLTVLMADGRITQTGTKVTPSTHGHIHICRTCGETMKETDR